MRVTRPLTLNLVLVNLIKVRLRWCGLKEMDDQVWLKNVAEDMMLRSDISCRVL